MSGIPWWAWPWWAWIVLAGVLALAEMAVPGSYLMWIALGAAVTGIAAPRDGAGGPARGVRDRDGGELHRRLFRLSRGCSRIATAGFR